MTYVHLTIMAEAMDTDGFSTVDADSCALTEKPTCILCLGMAGSGKTTFVQVRNVGLKKGFYCDTVYSI